eukprot:6203177-Pleurochrysis_carterae.AAC.5
MNWLSDQFTTHLPAENVRASALSLALISAFPLSALLPVFVLCALTPNTLLHFVPSLTPTPPFLTEANTTSDEFLNVARHAEGVHEAYLQIFLAHAEYDVFVALMVEKANADK